MTENRITVACEHFGKYIPKQNLYSFHESLKEVPDDCLDSLMTVQMKKPVTVLLFSIFLGGLGVDRFYLGDKTMGGWKLALSLICTIGMSIISMIVGAMGVPAFSVVVSLISLGLGIWRTIWGFFDIFTLYRRAKESNYMVLTYVVADRVKKDKVARAKEKLPQTRESALNKEEQ